ncbi:MAG: DUF4268 domain-containing protein [Flavobacteriaceae bacterium TMED120]|nr:MAG: DUF4268 domain-containing protein [Flavobacteriaceae bacterium TMED120]HCQ24238.1 hypothetical protein [Flavobacteriaceae bacterium]
MSIGVRYLNFIHNTRTSSVSVEFYIQEQFIFEKLFQNKQGFNTLCEDLEIDWQPLQDRKVLTTATHLKYELDNASQHKKHYEWLITKRETFVSTLKKLH